MTPREPISDEVLIAQAKVVYNTIRSLGLPELSYQGAILEVLMQELHERGWDVDKKSTTLKFKRREDA